MQLIAHDAGCPRTIQRSIWRWFFDCLAHCNDSVAIEQRLYTSKLQSSVPLARDRQDFVRPNFSVTVDRGIRKKKFHGFWDSDAVNALFSQVPGGLPKKEFEAQIEPLKHQLVHDMATHEPLNLQVPSNVSIDSNAEIWADEILPIAREAHARLEFRNVKPLLDGDRVVAMGEAIEKPTSDRTLYRTWATGIVRDELQKAGWRLADLLQKIL